MNCNINENDVFNATIVENDNIQCSLEDKNNVNSSVIARGLQGPKGDKGDKGDQGEQGIQGPKGDTGDDGFSPSASVVKIGTEATITITDKTGTTTAKIFDGQGSVDDVKVNGTSVVTNKVANVSVPTVVSELTNDAGYQNATQVNTAVASYHDSTKQNVTDNTLTTTSKNIVDAINEINAKPTVTSLSALTDVTLTTPADGEVLKYDEATEKWVNSEVQSGGAGMVCGQTIFSLDPLTNAGLHLLDGTVLPVGGSYDAFITNYIVPLYQSHPERFKTEAQWQAEYAQYGVCGYYVYTEGVSVRLPKVTGKVEGTLDASALGSVAPESLPNITGATRNGCMTASSANTDVNDVRGTGCCSGSTGVALKTFPNSTTSATWGRDGWVDINASLSSSTYQDNAPVKEQAVKGYLYIVVSTVTKTDIEVDIDQIQTDLNNKVDANSLAEINPMIATYVNGTEGYNIWANGYCEQWGFTTHSTDRETITLLKNFDNNNYNITLGASDESANTNSMYWTAKSSNTFTLVGTYNFDGCCWKASGYLADGEY